MVLGRKYDTKQFLEQLIGQLACWHGQTWHASKPNGVTSFVL